MLSNANGIEAIPQYSTERYDRRLDGTCNPRRKILGEVGSTRLGGKHKPV